MTDSKGFSYPGRELNVFSTAVRWKAYWRSRISRWVRGDVLEVGAGLGANTAIARDGRVHSWCCLEPDSALAHRLAGEVAHIPECSVIQGTIAKVEHLRFDSILYIDVLEHIEDDRQELAAAAKMLRPGGHLTVLSPAHQFLFSEFDASIGHCRRHNRSSLLACSPPGSRLEAMFYLDSVGLLASLANRYVLRRSHPTEGQIQVWDKYMVPLSRLVDPMLGYRLGKTICAVWTRYRT
jgi:SAM-dependent methyltransferase